MQGIDPKWAFWLGILIFLEEGIGQGTVKLTNVLPDSWIPYVVAWCALLAWAGGAVQTALIGFSNKQQGPLITAPVVPPSVKPLLLVGLALTALLMFGVGSAQAQNKVLKDVISGGAANAPSTSTGTTLPKDLLAALDDKLLPDLKYAKAMADANSNTITSNCWGAWIDIIQNRQAALKNPDGTLMTAPDPHLLSDFERAVELRNALQPDSKFSIACSPVAVMVKQDILGLISKVVAGGAGLSLLGIGL